MIVCIRKHKEDVNPAKILEQKDEKKTEDED